MAPAETAQAEAVALQEPAWFHDYAFSLAEVADALDVRFDTLAHWLHVLRVRGTPIHTKRKHRRLLTGQGAYLVGILAAVQKAGIAVSVEIIAQVYAVVNKSSPPQLPGLFDQIHLAETDIDGRPVARIEIEASQVWLVLEPKLQELIDA